jgi:glucokinase
MISRILQQPLIDIMAVGISLGPAGEAAGDGDSERRRLLISHLDSPGPSSRSWAGLRSC